MKYNITNISSFIFIILSVSGCYGADDCKRFPNSLNYSKLSLYSLKEVEIDSKFLSNVNNNINKCYKRRKFFVDEYDIVLKNVKRYGGDKYILSYEVIGVSDIFLAFVVAADGEVVEALEISSQ